MKPNLRDFIPLAMLASSLFFQSSAAAQQGDNPGRLHTIRQPGAHDVFVGDLLQVRYRTQATSVGIRSLRTEEEGPILSRVALINSPLDPDVQMLPGAPYFIIVYFKAEKPGQSIVKVTPLLNDGNQGPTFQFTAIVKARN